MKKRVTLPYKSKSGNDYLFDDSTCMIFKWNELYESILSLEDLNKEQIIENLKNRFELVELSKAIDFINGWKNDFNAFYREENYEFDSLPTKDELYNYLSNSLSNQLILSVTDDCNLRCKYCIFSDAYSLTKNKSHKFMSFDIAKSAVDYYFSVIKNQMKANPYKKFAITFYGGEPLLNVEIIKYVIDYVNAKHPNRILFNITTNAVLLNDDIITFFIKNNVYICISLDGDKEENDKLRVKVNGVGSYEDIIRALTKIKNKNAKYFDENVKILSVYDICSDVEKISNFFNETNKLGIIPKILFVSQVSKTSTNYYEKFTEENYKNHQLMITKLKDKYMFDIINNNEIGQYLKILIGNSITTMALRSRQNDMKSSLIPFSGACIPGQKVCVNSNGNFDICERVSGNKPIGNVQKGLDLDKILDIIDNYRNKVISDCSKCSIASLCSYCYVQFENEEGFKKDMKRDCGVLISSMQQILSNYSTICEENPGKQLEFERDYINLIEKY